MRRGMLLMLMSVVGVLLTSCEKDETPNLMQDRFVNASSPIPPRKLTFDMLDVHWVRRDASNQIAYTPSGWRYEFTEVNERYSVLVQVDVAEDGSVSGIVGRYNGHPFIVWGGVVNICNGQQGVSVSYELR
jgi:hypothetical protein